MTPKLVLLVIATVGIAPAVSWSFISVVTRFVSLVWRPVSLSARLYSTTDGTSKSVYFELPGFASFCILVGAALLIFGISSISRTS